MYLSRVIRMGLIDWRAFQKLSVWNTICLTILIIGIAFVTNDFYQRIYLVIGGTGMLIINFGWLAKKFFPSLFKR